MPGYFGDDFDVTQPEDASPVKYGASWLRDIKTRLKRFMSVMFNLETGAMKNDVVTSDMLTDLTTAGTYTEVTVNSKGLVTAGSNPLTQKSATVYRAIFPFGISPSAQIDNTSGTTDSLAATSTSTYDGGSTPYVNTYASLANSQYATYVWTVPTGVRRVKATIIGGGGAQDDSTADSYGGAGGEMVITTFNVEPAEVTSLTILVGGGGAVASGTTGNPGGVSMVYIGSTNYAEACGGSGGSVSAAGSAVTGSAGGVLTTIRFPGQNGASDQGGETGSYLQTYGRGAPDQANDQNGDDGVVILEWVV